MRLSFHHLQTNNMLCYFSIIITCFYRFLLLLPKSCLIPFFFSFCFALFPLGNRKEAIGKMSSLHSCFRVSSQCGNTQKLRQWIPEPNNLKEFGVTCFRISFLFNFPYQLLYCLPVFLSVYYYLFLLFLPCK